MKRDGRKVVDVYVNILLFLVVINNLALSAVSDKYSIFCIHGSVHFFPLVLFIFTK